MLDDGACECFDISSDTSGDSTQQVEYDADPHDEKKDTDEKEEKEGEGADEEDTDAAGTPKADEEKGHLAVQKALKKDTLERHSVGQAVCSPVARRLRSLGVP